VITIKLNATVRPRSLVIIAACVNAFQDLIDEGWKDDLPTELRITSGNDSTHMDGSKHYTDEALDVRSKSFPSRHLKNEFIRLVKFRLGSAYQGILESEGQPNEHFHFEYDPK
jgi:hypothetical protein